MPIPQTIRVNPLDLQGNIAIGVSLPFDGPAAFNSTYSTADQIKSNLINLLLTNKGERIMNPEFGADLKIVLFEGITEDTSDIIRNFRRFLLHLLHLLLVLFLEVWLIFYLFVP